ncbi:uncharacterized protein LOC119371301 [Jatropha curcas]|uniref:uncharacterized protein LOC119371301 n=1 Tax=Jatropha curcas TaxID=180498 RepID=UPI00189300A5|nr:uncharacterized protein LOC119371301 [Jatropha curcas]
MAIGGRVKAHYLTGMPPETSDPTFERWEQSDQNVFTWIIQNIESNLINNAAQYPTAKSLWNGLAITYGSGVDSLQTYDLHRKASTIRQGQETLENLWNKLQSIWMSIEHNIQQPNPCGMG